MDADGLTAFAIGAVAGGVGAATFGVGFAAMGGTGFVAGAVAGFFGYMAATPILAAGNNVAFGDPLPTAGEYFTGLGVAALGAGLTSGLDAHLKGGDFWSGNPKASTLFDAQVSAISETQKAKMPTASGGTDNASWGGKTSVDSYLDKYAYRALTAVDAKNIEAGRGIIAKNPNGNWSLENHLIKGSSKAALTNNPWISTTSKIKIAESFSSGNGIVKIDLSKIPASSIQNGYMSLPRSSAGYHYSIWQQENSVFRYIPMSAIVK